MERQLTVQVTGNDTPANYTLRGLSDEEVPSWAEFCASVFAYKDNPPPASYFARHFYNDPDRNASFIRVAMFEEKVVASCRIFHRTISGGNGFAGTIRAGGIGEVCTLEAHRKRGLSKELLLDAIQIMESEGMQLSLLHAAPSFFPVYQKVGYVCTVSKWSTTLIQRDRLSSVALDENVAISHAKFPDDIKQLMQLHQKYYEKNFAGAIVRSELYWNNYLSHELEGSLWLLKKKTGTDEDTVLGWLSLRSRGDKLQLREFGCNLDLTTIDKVLPSLLGYASNRILSDSSDDTIKLHLPTFIIDAIEQQKQGSDFQLWENEIEQANDEGWMYRPLGQQGVSMPDISDQCPHLIWPADSF